MPLPWPFAKKNSSADVNVDEEDVEAIILRNLWKRHRILPPYSVYKQYWDVVCCHVPQHLLTLLCHASCGWRVARGLTWFWAFCR